MTERSMQEPTFLILTALAAGPQHGYGVITDILRISDDRVRLRAGTLYAALDRLQGEGLVEAGGEEVVDGRARRYYRLTSAGATRLAGEAERLRRHADTAVSRLGARLGVPARPAAAPGGAA
ncbi:MULTISPECIES: helix-turn-helix transcriptional regulator [unclassified Nonomuraea]|uniref:PadR family transcriptional regulator n=1 Tax=unclassified Nonomuraea TaxID=2593643 RepID=UPI0033F25555